MKITKLGVTLGLAALVVAGCTANGLSNQNDDSGYHSPATGYTEQLTAPEHDSVNSRSMADQAYLDTLDKGGVPYSTPDKAILGGRAVCEFRSTAPNNSVFATAAWIMRSTNYTAEQAGYLTGAATAAFCPEYSDTAGY